MIVFEEFKFRYFLACFISIYRQKQIWIVDADAINNKVKTYGKILRWCQRLVPGLKIHYLRHKDHPDVFFSANEKLAHFVDKQAELLRATQSFKMVTRIYPGPGALLGLQRSLLDHIHCFAYFSEVVARYSSGKEVIVIPKEPDNFGILKTQENVIIPKLIKLLNFCSQLVLPLTLLPRWILLIAVNPLRADADITPVETKYTVQAVWPGVDEASLGVDSPKGAAKKSMGVKSRWNSFFLEDGITTKASDILYCFGDWVIEANERAKMESQIKRSGSQFCDMGGHLPPRKIVWKNFILKMGLGSLPFVFRGLCSGPQNWWTLKWGLILLRTSQSWEGFAHNFKSKVFLSYDDQVINHIARTMVFEQYGQFNCGLHHPSFAGVKALPQTAFVHFHLRFLYGRALRKEFAPFWDRSPYLETGPYKSDLIHQSMNCNEVRQKFEKRYSGRKNILVAIPKSKTLPNLYDRSIQFFDALVDLASKRPDFRYIFRPRTASGHPEEIEAYLDRLINEHGAVIELKNFDTYELIAYCDVVVAPTSSMVEETLNAGKRPVVFCFNGIDENYRYSTGTNYFATTNPLDVGPLIEAAIEAPEAPPELGEGVAAKHYGQALRSIRWAMNALFEGNSPEEVMSSFYEENTIDNNLNSSKVTIKEAF